MRFKFYIGLLAHLGAALTVGLLSAGDAVAAIPASATPGGYLPLTPEAEADVGIANSYWGSPPTACASISVAMAPVIFLSGEPESGLATIPPSGASGIPCEVIVASTLPPPLLCSVMVHEFGHLHGLQHSPDPGNIMFEGSPLAAVIPGCPLAPPAPEPPSYSVELQREQRCAALEAREFREHRMAKARAWSRVRKCWRIARRLNDGELAAKSSPAP